MDPNQRSEKVAEIRDNIMRQARHLGVTAQEVAADTIHDLRSLTEDQRNGVRNAILFGLVLGLVLGFALGKAFS